MGASTPWPGARSGTARRRGHPASSWAAVDSAAEYGGFALHSDNVEMLACIDEKRDWLTDDWRLGYVDWRADPGVFLARAML